MRSFVSFSGTPTDTCTGRRRWHLLTEIAMKLPCETPSTLHARTETRMSPLVVPFPERISGLLWGGLVSYLCFCGYLSVLVAQGRSSDLCGLIAAWIITLLLSWEVALRIRGVRLRLVDDQLLFRRYFFLRPIPLERITTSLEEHDGGFVLDTREVFMKVSPVDRARFRSAFFRWKAATLGYCQFGEPRDASSVRRV